MQITNSTMRLVGRPVGVSLISGQGTSGVFCGVQRDEILLLEYMYQDSFALKHYPLTSVRNMLPFPPCHEIPRPGPRPHNRLY